MGRGLELLGAAAVVLVSVGCAAVAGGSPTPVGSPPGQPSAITASTGSSIAERPPDVGLAADGGDAVIGQLGTYTWGDGGSDSPWLPGAPLSVAAGERLTARIVGDVPVTSWSARRAPGDATGDSAAVPYRAGGAVVAFEAPEAGDWTIAVTIRFANGGVATYAWRLDVT